MVKKKVDWLDNSGLEKQLYGKFAFFFFLSLTHVRLSVKEIYRTCKKRRKKKNLLVLDKEFEREALI